MRASQVTITQPLSSPSPPQTLVHFHINNLLRGNDAAANLEGILSQQMCTREG